MHTDCGGGVGGIERVEGALWLESAFGHRIAFFVASETASARRRKDSPDSSVCFQRGHSIWISDLRALSLPVASQKISR